MAVKVRYFAWVRERVGKSEETLELPADIATIADLAAWLAGRGANYRAAFADAKVLRAAIDQAHVRPEAAIAGAREIAFFPPVTGG